MNTRALIESVIRPVVQLGRPFGLLFIAGVLSDIGGFTTQTALVLHIYRLTDHNAAYMGLMAIATILPMILAAPIGGVWAEKYDRRRVMVCNDLLRIPLVLAMMLTNSVLALLLLQAMVCASTALFMPSQQSLIPALVRPERLQLANTLSGGVLSVVHVLGPLLGAMLYAYTGALTGVVLIEALTYACSALMLINLPACARPARSGRALGVRREILDGLRYVVGEPDLRQIFTMLSAAGLTVGLFLTLLRPFISEVLHGDDRTYATIVSAFGLGGMLGPVFGFWAGRRLGLGRMLTVCFCLEPILLVLWSRTESLGPSTALLFLWGVDVFALIPCYTSYLHIYSSRDHMGRTFALFDQSAYVPQIIAAAVVTCVGNRLPTQNILTMAGIGYLLIVLGTLGTTGSRLLRGRNGRPRGKRALGAGGTPGRPGRPARARNPPRNPGWAPGNSS